MRKIQIHGKMEPTVICRRRIGREEWGQRGEGISRRTCMNDPWTWTRERGLTVGKKGGLGRGGQKGKIGTSVTE